MCWLSCHYGKKKFGFPALSGFCKRLIKLWSISDVFTNSGIVFVYPLVGNWNIFSRELSYLVKPAMSDNLIYDNLFYCGSPDNHIVELGKKRSQCNLLVISFVLVF